MNSFRSITSPALALFLGAGSLAVSAQSAQPAPAMPAAGGCPMMGQAPGQEKSHDWLQGRMAAQLQLTEAQKASLKAITDKHKASLASKRKAVMDARRAFFTALQNNDSSADALKTLHRTLSDLTFERMMEGRAMRQEIRAVLTPEQREKAARMEGRMEGMRMARSGFRGEGGMMRGHRGEPGPLAGDPDTAQAQ